MEDENPTDDFAQLFAPAERGECKLYLISPQEVGGGFPDRLKAALEPGVAAAFQLRVVLDAHPGQLLRRRAVRHLGLEHLVGGCVLAVVSLTDRDARDRHL